MSRLKKFFFRAKKTSDNKEKHPAFPPDLLLYAENTPITVELLDEQFYSYMLGNNSMVDSVLNPFERRVIKQMKDLLKAGSHESSILPRLPLVLPKIMRSLRDENADSYEITALIEKEPALVGDVMKLINSPFYRTREKITSLQQATVMLGRAGLGRLVSNAIIKPVVNLKNGHFSQLGSQNLWEQAEKTAIASSLLCKDNEERQFHAYLSGILQNIGFTLGFKILDSTFDGTHTPNSKKFQTTFVILCHKLTAKMVNSWGMPHQICDYFNSAHKIKNDESLRILSENLFIADKLSKAQILGNKINLDPITAKILLNQQTCVKCRQALDAINHTVN